VVAWTIGLPLVLAGWWYVRLVIVTGSILGEKGSLTAANGAHGPGILHAPAIAWRWIAGVYRSYWFDYNSYEVTHQDVWFWLPAIGIGLVAIGVVLFLGRSWGTLRDPERPELRQVAILVVAALLLLVPPLALDTLRGVRGLSFTTQQGRFLTPAYPALAVIAVIAIRELTTRSARVFRISVAAFVAGAFVVYCHTWVVWVLERFYGPISGDWGRALYHASFDKPNFITRGSLAVLMIGAVLSFICAYAVTIRGARAGRDGQRVAAGRTPSLARLRPRS
jgi:hypothetical protein